MTAPPVTIVPPTPDQWKGAPPDDEWTAVFELDTATGELSVRPNRGGNPSWRLHGLYDDARDLWVRGDCGFERTPRRLGFLTFQDITPEQAATALQRMAITAETLLESLEELEDGTWDWTVEAAAAYNRMVEGCADDGSRGLVSFSTVMENVHDVDRLDLWNASGMTDKGLEEAAFLVTSRPLPPTADVLKLEEAHGGSNSIYVVGARAGLRRLRAAQLERIGELPAVAASEWWAEGIPTVLQVSSLSEDGQLEHLAGLVAATVATRHGKRLTGALEYLRAHRDHLRDLRAADLAGVVRQVGYHEEELEKARRRREALIEDVLSFRLARHYDARGRLRVTAVAEEFGLSKQGLIDLVRRISDRNGEQAPEGEDTADA